MEIAKKAPKENILKSLIYKPANPFVSKREIDWMRIIVSAEVSISVCVLGILFLPTGKKAVDNYHERAEAGSTEPKVRATSPTEDTLSQIQAGRTNLARVPGSTDYIFGRNGSDAGSGHDRSSPMILSRSGFDARTQMPPGTKLFFRLTDRVVVRDQAVPIIGVTTKDTIQENSLAIPAGAKLLGLATFDATNERAQIAWRAVQFPDGRQRPLTAIGQGPDGQPGIEGKISSHAFRNTAGQTLSRFVAAYAEGSSRRGSLGANEGGEDNGWRNAVAETARERTDAYAEDMKKEKKWIEIESRTENTAVLIEPFTFRDPGATQSR